MIAGIGLLVLTSVGVTVADDYVEDVYYWPDAATPDAQQGALVPSYNPRAREIIFIEDSTAGEHPDTVRAIIRDIRTENKR